MTNIWSWVLWAILLFSQNWAFTFVSRARNSASLKRHIIAAQLSNGIWIVSIAITMGKLIDFLVGKSGWQLALFTAVFYTTFTTLGSVVAHAISLKTEKGKSAVGASAQYAQIKKEDWDHVVEAVLMLGADFLERTKQLPSQQTIEAEAEVVNG